MSWEVIEWIGDECTQSFDIFDVASQNANNGCSGGDGGQVTEFAVFLGRRVQSGFLTVWDWDYEGTISVTNGQTRSDKFFSFASRSAPGYAGILLGRLNTSSTWPHPRWIDVARTSTQP